MNTTIFLVCIIIGCMLFMVLILRKKILSFFYPQNYIYLFMLSNTNNFTIKMEDKPVGNKIEKAGGTYFLVKESEFLYKRIASYLIIEGHMNSIDLRLTGAGMNPEMLKRTLELKFGDMWKIDGMENFLKNNSTLIFIILGAIAIFLLWRNGNISTQMLGNATKVVK